MQNLDVRSFVKLNPRPRITHKPVQVDIFNIFCNFNLFKLLAVL